MLLVTQTTELQKRFGIEKAIQMIAGAGFDAIDFSMFEMNDDNSILNSDKCFEYAKQLKETAQNALVVVITHENAELLDAQKTIVMEKL